MLIICENALLNITLTLEIPIYSFFINHTPPPLPSPILMSQEETPWPGRLNRTELLHYFEIKGWYKYFSLKRSAFSLKPNALKSVRKLIDYETYFSKGKQVKLFIFFILFFFFFSETVVDKAITSACNQRCEDKLCRALSMTTRFACR